MYVHDSGRTVLLTGGFLRGRVDPQSANKNLTPAQEAVLLELRKVLMTVDQMYVPPPPGGGATIYISPLCLTSPYPSRPIVYLTENLIFFPHLNS